MPCGIQNRWLLWSETPSLGHKYSLPDRFALSSRAREKDWPWSWIKKMCPDPETSQPSLKKLDNIAQNLHRSLQSFGTISSCPWYSHMWVSRSLNTHPCCPRGDGWPSPFLFATSFFFQSWMTTLGIPCVYQTGEVWMTSGPQAPPKCKPTVRISTEHAAGLFSFLQSKKASHFQNGQTLTVGLIACGRESFGWRATEMCVPLSPFLPQLSAEHPLAWNQLCLLSSIMDNSTESGWGASTLSLTVTSVYFLPLPIALLWSESFPPASDEKVKSHRTSLPKVTQCSNVLPEPKPSALHLEQAKCRMILSEYHPRECRFQKNHTQIQQKIDSQPSFIFPQVILHKRAQGRPTLHWVQISEMNIWLNCLVGIPPLWNGQAVFVESHAYPWWSPR